MATIFKQKYLPILNSNKLIVLNSKTIVKKPSDIITRKISTDTTTVTKEQYQNSKHRFTPFSC